MLRRAERQGVAAVLAIAAAALSVGAAEARCIHTGPVASCIIPGSKPIMLSCYGVGGVLTCIDANGKSVMVAHHWHLMLTPDATAAATDDTAVSPSPDESDFDAQLTSALQANAATSRKADRNSRTTQQRSR